MLTFFPTPYEDELWYSRSAARECFIPARLRFTALSVPVSDAVSTSEKETGVPARVLEWDKYAAKISVHDQEERYGDTPPLLSEVHG